MKVKLAYKLLGSFLVTLLLVFGALMLSRYLFVHNFKAYIHQVEIERLKSFVPLLQEEYRNHGGWSGVKENRRYWRRRLQHEIQFPDSVQQSEERRKKASGHRPRPKHSNGKMRYLLSDAELNPIIGKPSPNDKPRLVAIQVDGRTVGWLGLTHNEQFPKGPPADFINQQYRLYYLLGGVVLLITMLIAALLTRHLVRPVKRLTEGTRALANRDFSVRIKDTGRDEFGQLAEDFNAMAQTLQTYERLRKQWLSDISHELRTPLSILRGEIEALLDGVRQPTLKNLTSLHVEALHLGKLVEDLHLISMADSDELRLNKRSIAPMDVLEMTVDAFRERFDERKIYLHLPWHEFGDIRICGDADRLGQVFTNILENVCKYTNSPGTLSIRIAVDRQAVAIYFKDSGPGVPEESLPRLFDRLYRVDSSRGRNRGGSGLGLPICRNIIDYHGGNIWAENNANGGLTIGIRLPLEKK